MAAIRRLGATLMLAIVLFAFGPTRARAQTPDSQPGGGGEPPTTLNIDRLPIDISKIQRALSRPPALKLETSRTVFRVEIFGRTPSIEDILGPDYLRGPVPGGVMTHQEFLNMVTPRDVQGYAAFDNKQALTIAATSFALKWALQKALDKYQSAKEERGREAAKREVEEALAELRRARRAAGLPDK
jgi:hypothetical protein